MNERPHLDEEALAELQEVMEEEFDILINTYLKDSRERIDALRAALQQPDFDTFTKAAHSFKGSCFNIGAPRLGSLCQQAETAGREGRLDEADDLVGLIDAEFVTIRDMLERSLKT